LQTSPADEYSAVLNCGVDPVEDMRGKYHAEYVAKSKIAPVATTVSIGRWV